MEKAETALAGPLTFPRDYGTPSRKMFHRILPPNCLTPNRTHASRCCFAGITLPGTVILSELGVIREAGSDEEPKDPDNVTALLTVVAHFHLAAGSGSLHPNRPQANIEF